MSIVYNPNRRGRQQNQGQQGNMLSTGPAAGPVSGGGANSSGLGMGTPSSQKMGSSGRFQNIQSFVKANDPAQFASQVKQKVEDVKQQGQQDLQRSQQQLQEQAAQIGQQIAQTREAQQNFAQAWRQGLEQDQAIQDFDTGFQALEQGSQMQYGGVDELQNQSTLRARVQDLEGIGQAAQTQAGRAGLLQRFFGNPQYTSGQKTLDSALLGSRARDMRKMVGQAAAFRGELDQAVQQAQRDIGAQRADIEALRGESKSLADILRQEGEADIRDQFQRFVQEEAQRRAQVLDPNRQVQAAMGLDIGAGGRLDIDSKTLQDLGILRFRSDIDNIDQNDLQQIARVNRNMAEQLNRLRTLAGQSQLQLGDQFQAGGEQIDQEALNRTMQNLQSDWQNWAREKYLGDQARTMSGDVEVDWSVKGRTFDFSPEHLAQVARDLIRDPAAAAALRARYQNTSLGTAAMLEARRLMAVNRNREWQEVQNKMRQVMTEGTQEHAQARQNIFRHLLRMMASRARGEG